MLNRNEQNLLDAYKDDLRTDIRCAIRDGLLQYAKDQQKELDALEFTSIAHIRINEFGRPVIKQ